MSIRLAKIKHFNPRSELNAALRLDSGLRAVLDICGYPASRRRRAEFATLAQIINAQQLSTHAAAAIWHRVERHCNGAVTARKVLNRGATGLAECGLSARKAAYILALAEEVRTRRLDIAALAQLADADVIARLTALKGIGQWSAEIFAMFALGRRDIFPAGDLALRVAVQRYRGIRQRLQPDEVAEFAGRWSPHRSSVALLLWRYYGATTLQ